MIDPQSGEAMVFELTSEGVSFWLDYSMQHLTASDLPDGINLKAIWRFETITDDKAVHQYQWSKGEFNVILQAALETLRDNPGIEVTMFS